MIGRKAKATPPHPLAESLKDIAEALRERMKEIEDLKARVAALEQARRPLDAVSKRTP